MVPQKIVSNVIFILNKCTNSDRYLICNLKEAGAPICNLEAGAGFYDMKTETFMEMGC